MGGGWETILIIVLMGGVLYFMMIRPQQKRTKEQKAKIAALGPGSRVMTISGIIGTVKHLGEKQAILELAPGVEMTIVKAAISTQAVDDEFEYSSDLDGSAEEPEFIEDTLTDAIEFDPTRPDEPEGADASPIAGVEPLDLEASADAEAVDSKN